MKRTVLIIIAFLLPVTLTIHSCKSKTKETAGTEMAEKMMEQATGADIELENGGANVTIEGNGEKVQINQQAREWPAEISGEVPQLTDGEIIRVVKSETNENFTWNVYYKPVPVETISAYGDAMKSNGFEVMKMQMPKGGQVTGQKGEFLIMCIYSEETCMVSIQQPK
jgi:hypothetical protein